VPVPERNEWHSIDPFAAAMAKISADITITWSVADMQSLRPEWSKAQCAAFMRCVAKHLAPEVLRVGLAMLLVMSQNPKWQPPADPQKMNQDGGEDPGKYLKESL
jgi:hypothetical protein